LEKGDLGGFKNLQTEGIYGKRYISEKQSILQASPEKLDSQSERAAWEQALTLPAAGPES